MNECDAEKFEEAEVMVKGAEFRTRFAGMQAKAASAREAAATSSVDCEKLQA